MTNRLVDSLSPYLQQHADNPVDWWEWSDAALAEARRQDVPILLSVGYATCHWCHVMAHESFEGTQVAAAINANFVAIKVDREERPDIDIAYMAATTALTGNAGWPMTCLLTPSGKPFFAGTYLPKHQFLQILSAAHQAWTDQRDQVLTSSDHITEQLASATTWNAPVALTEDALTSSVSQLSQTYDERNGGFGTAPKFPPSMVLEFLLRHHARTGNTEALRMSTGTCDAMARGGIYDQLAGGFARYSVDATWTVPHFEKMLYDNAQLLHVYAHLARQSDSILAERISSETADFIIGHLGTTEGSFASALDADAGGVEGLTYVWTPAQLREVLGPDDGPRAAALLAVTMSGTFEHGSSTLQLPTDPDDHEWWSRTREKLLTQRRSRPQPTLDDKIVTSWNGLAITALVEAGMILNEPRWVTAAERCAQFLIATHLVSGRLRRTSRRGQVAAAPGVANDYGNLASGLLTLHQATGNVEYLTVAKQLLDTATAHFTATDGGFHDVSDDMERLYLTPRERGDNAEPSGTSSIAGALLTLSAITGDTDARTRSDQAIASISEIGTADSRFAGWTLAVAEAGTAGPLQIAIVGDDRSARSMARAAWLSTSSGLVRIQGQADATGIPLLADRTRIQGRSTAYICRGFVCTQPIVDVAELRRHLNVE